MKVNDKVTLFTFRFTAAMNFISKKKNELHYEHNLTAWRAYVKSHGTDRFIEHQNDMTDVFYGAALPFLTKALYKQGYQQGIPAAANACEVIAVYNVTKALNKEHAPIDFPELLQRFEKKGACLAGNIGTSPKSLLQYLQKNGYDAKLVAAGKMNELAVDTFSGQYEAFIYTAFNDKNDITKEVHTIAITRGEDGKYYMHNAGTRYKGVGYASLYEAMTSYRDGNAGFVSLIGVNRETAAL